MQNLPLISVIVPVYKVEKYLDACVASILGQTYTNLELILVEDGSPDNSGALCDAWAQKNPRVRVIHKENGGGGLARNVGLDAARGERIAFVDSDDYIAPHMFAYLYSLLEQGADIAECGYVDVEEDGFVFPEEEGEVRFVTPEEALRGNLYDIHFRQLIWNKLYRRCVIGDIRFPVGTKIDDEFFTYKVLGNARKLARSEKICYAYRQQSGSVMHENYSLRRLEGLHAKAERLAYLKENFPQLQRDGKMILFFSCMHAMQMCRKFLSKAEQKLAWEDIRGILKEAGPVSLTEGSGIKEKVWIGMSKVSFRLTCDVRNFLFERD